MPITCTVGVRLKPNARLEKIEATDDGSLAAWVHAAPVEGRANAALVTLLAKKLDVPKSSVTVLHGLASRSKVVRVVGLTKEAIFAKMK